MNISEPILKVCTNNNLFMYNYVMLVHVAGE